MKRFIALLLALIMLFSLVSCGKKAPVADIVEGDAVQKIEETYVDREKSTVDKSEPVVDKVESVVDDKTDDTVEMAPISAETDRETLEQIADMVGAEKEDVSSMDDDTLKDFIYSELDKEVADLTPSQDAVTGDNPAVDSTGKEEYYEEDGSMNQPFDVIYPELVENGEVEYAEDALLLKISNSQGATITSGMQSAGVAKLESVVPMSEYTWYKASLVSGTDISAAVTELRSLSEIAMVDYDYVVEATAMDEYKELPSQFNANQTDRWEHHICGVPDAYKELKSPGGSSSVIVAVIDTGVDYTHEDLKQNIWVNAAETPDNGIDDDGNGFVDDYYGVNVVAGSGSGNDDHGHGTHVAGIVAAQNNNMGVAGLAYNCKVMPIKAGNHSGYFLQSDIAKAVLYAYENGAEVINMSFGGTACSQAVQDALSTAYARCVLVASAGNNGAPNEGLLAVPNYPAALTYVVGVMAVDRYGTESSFTNYDAAPFNKVEYEVYAPGVDIVSTIPGNSYATWSGTSMAAPYVSAIAAILRSEYTDRDKYPTKFIYGQLCATSEDTATCLDPKAHGLHNLPMIVNLHDALTKLPKPSLGVSDFIYFDTVGMEQDAAGKNTGDGAVDAGETIALGLTLRNRWGMSENTVVTIDTLSPTGLPDPFVTIVNDTVNYGSVGTYSTQDCGRIYTDEIITGWKNPFYIKIADNCPNDYIVTLNVTIEAENGMDEADESVYVFEDTVSFVVRNGLVLPSIIDEDMTLTKDNLYIIASGVLVSEGATVTVEAGTHIQFYTADANDPYAATYIPQLTVAGAFITNGTDNNPVYIYPSDLYLNYYVPMETTGTGYIFLNGVDITNFESSNRESYIDAKNSVFRANPDITTGYFFDRRLVSGQVEDYEMNVLGMTALKTVDSCAFYKVPDVWLDGYFRNCAFIDCAITADYSEYYAQNCLFLGNCYENARGETKVTGSNIRTGREFTIKTSEIVCCEETGTAYLILEPKSFYSTYAIDEYLSSLGIFKAKLQTEEDLALLHNVLPMYRESDGSPQLYDFGIHFDLALKAFVWADGTPVGEWISPENNNYNVYQSRMFYSPNFEMFYYRSNDSQVPIVYELPGEDTASWSVDELLSGLTTVRENANEMFYGNAVLNRISTVTNLEKWMRVQAPNAPGTTVPLGGNHWGTTNARAIELQLIDGRNYGSFAVLDYEPYLTTAPELVFPYVTGVTIRNADGETVSRVGSEEITVTVTFSRDMNTEQPVEVAFGSSEPYRDYLIEGDFVDSRTWVGTYFVSTVIENGYEFFSISGGEADNDKDLYTDWARFGFEIDTTAAQAMIMQGSANEAGITLTWMQDDFDTLMGYNVYRSTALDGQYQRLNSSIIPADTKTFFDDTVEPGKQYFYNFTVVKTDLTESEPSGKITLWSLDTMAPNVYHSAVGSATMGSNLIITATVIDNLRLETVKLMYRTTGTEEYKVATMNNNNDKYSAIIPAVDLSTDGLEYYIDAFDGISHAYWRSAETPWSVAVIESVTTSDLGDVDGNGVINLLDALMVLKAKNHKLNLTAEQFARADLDGNNTLEAWEALRILQYASGTVGSVLP